MVGLPPHANWQRVSDILCQCTQRGTARVDRPLLFFAIWYPAPLFLGTSWVKQIRRNGKTGIADDVVAWYNEKN